MNMNYNESAFQMLLVPTYLPPLPLYRASFNKRATAFMDPSSPSDDEGTIDYQSKPTPQMNQRGKRSDHLLPRLVVT
jgi:hypothetical protein